MKIYDYNGKKNLCGNRIREARLRQRLSQYDLAARLQTQGILIEQDSISRIEIGTRDVYKRQYLKLPPLRMCDHVSDPPSTPIMATSVPPIA